MRRAWIALVLVLVGASVLTASLNPFGSNEVPDVVRRAATANRRVSYAGRAFWKGRRWTRSVAIRHDSSAGLTAYRHNSHEFVLPGPSSRMSDPSAWCLDLDAVLQNYRSRTTGTSALLGRTTRTLVLEPLHPGRPTVTLHLFHRVPNTTPREVIMTKASHHTLTPCVIWGGAVQPKQS